MLKKLTLLIVLVLSALSTYQSFVLIDSVSWLYGLMYLVFPLWAVLGGVFLLMNLGKKAIQFRGVFLVTVGLTSFFVAEIIWYLYELAGQEPFPSPADIFYLAAYPFFFLGIRHLIKSAKATWENLSSMSLIFMTVASAFFIAMTLYYGVFEAFDVESGWIENIIGISYGIADLAIILALILLYGVLHEFRGGKIYRPWIYFLIGMFSFLGADILFAAFTDMYETELSFALQVDSLWMTGYAFMSYCLFDIGFVIQDLRKKITTP